MIKLVVILLIMMSLTSCSLLTRIIDINKKPTNIPIIHPEKPTPIVAQGITIRVITPDVARKLNDDIAAHKIPPYVFFAFPEKDYLTFAAWLQDVLRYIKEQDAIIEYYNTHLLLQHNKTDKE